MKYLQSHGIILKVKLKNTKMIVKGTPASQGKVKGIGRVVISLDKIDKFKKGDILVTRATSPSWTPFIHASSGVITEFGSSLSHAAIISREYGKPAVVGVKDATELIKDGQTIEMDATNGVITI